MTRPRTNRLGSGASSIPDEKTKLFSCYCFRIQNDFKVLLLLLGTVFRLINKSFKTHQTDCLITN